MNASTPFRLLRPALLSLCLLPALPAAVKKKPVPADTGEPKPYVLFMGADLDVERSSMYYRVRDVIGSELKIRIGQKEFLVPTHRRQTGIKVDYGLKLTAAAAQLDGLEAGPGYTPANDPRHKFDRESGAAGGAAAVQDLAYGAMISASLGASLSAGAAASAAGGAGAAAAQGAADAAQGRLDDAMRQFDMANASMGQDRYNTGQQAHRMMQELDEANYDAMEVAFKISSPVELEEPYVVILFKFLERGAKPGQDSLLIHAKALEPIGPKPKYIRIREGGLPVGFKYLDSEVHVYNRGREVATNVSPKRVELSRTEAHQYLLIDHLGMHKGATVPAAPVPGTLPRGLRQQFSLDQLNRTLHVRISPEGALLGAYIDEACSLQLDDPAALAALGEVFYLPALAQGKAMEGTAKVRLADL